MKTNTNKTDFDEAAKLSFAQKYPIQVFLLIFGGIMLLFYVLAYTGFYKLYIAKPIALANAYIGSLILNVLGQGTSVFDDSIRSNTFSFSIKEGCDAIEPTMIFLAGILAFPVNASQKWRPMITGALFLLSFNLIRIISLFLVGVYAKGAFEIMHVEVWQTIFVLLAIFTFLYWMRKLILRNAVKI